jgi:CheY-specific phosphatase CheX
MLMVEPNQILSDSLAEVVENMFFTTVTGDSDPSDISSERWISARLSFHGTSEGHFGVRVPPETGRKIAANFLGPEEEALTESQVSEVICELANMLCGSVLSRLERTSAFDLSQPEREPPDAGYPENLAACRAFFLDEGPLVMWLELAQTG